MRISNAQHMVDFDFWEKIFPAVNMPEIAVFVDFHWTFSLYLVVFLHKNIINNNTHHKNGSIVNETVFWSRNFLKIARIADFCRKSVIYIIFTKFCTLMQNKNT